MKTLNALTRIPTFRIATPRDLIVRSHVPTSDDHLFVWKHSAVPPSAFVRRDMHSVTKENACHMQSAAKKLIAVKKIQQKKHQRVVNCLAMKGVTQSTTNGAVLNAIVLRAESQSQTMPLPPAKNHCALDTAPWSRMQPQAASNVSVPRATRKRCM